MNKRPISEARDPDLRGSEPALHRAAQRARELAAQTGTAIVVSRNGVLEYIYPGRRGAAGQVSEVEPPGESSE